MSEQQKQKLLADGPLMSLSSAAEYTPYSAEYLSLLARKRRLAAVKIARDWLTTKHAVEFYTEEQKQKHFKFYEKLGLVSADSCEVPSHSTHSESAAEIEEGGLS